MSDEWKEPKIHINGETLTVAESMTLRVAVSSFHAELKQDGLGDDETGKQLSDGYIKACESIFRKMGMGNEHT
jgi:hypothetical protein